MEIKQLIYFKSIAEHGSISRAARDLHMSQPPLSYAIAQLEEELGVKLFNRSAKGIQLTEAGRVFYQRASDILNRSTSAAREVSMIGEKKTFRIGVTPTVVPVISSYLCLLEKENGGVLLELHEGNTYQLKQLLDDGTLDAAFIRTPVNLQGCKFLNILDEPMTAVFPSHHQISSISLKELEHEPLIVYRRYEQLIQDAFAKYSLTMKITCECDDARTAIKLAEDGLGTAIVPQAIAKSQKTLSVATIQAKELSTSVLLAWHNTSPLLNDFINLLKH